MLEEDPELTTFLLVDEFLVLVDGDLGWDFWGVLLIGVLTIFFSELLGLLLAGLIDGVEIALLIINIHIIKFFDRNY